MQKQRCLRKPGFLFLALFLAPRIVLAASGTEGASFLNIPVGARPASLGSAYSALAVDAYATTWNPGGLGRITAPQIAGQHLSYLEGIHYEYAGFVYPVAPGRTIGTSIQYLGSGDIAGTNLDGDSIGDFSAHYAAYSVAYGQSINEKASIGLTGKLINAKISDVSATAYAFDMGSMYKVNQRFVLAGVLRNVGSKLKFIDQGDALPLAFHAGGAYTVNSSLSLILEGVYRQTGLASAHTGIEWKPLKPLTLRAGYRTDTLAGLSPIAGFTTGIGLEIMGQEFSYAWVPMGEFGNTQYFSMLLRFGEEKQGLKRNLIQYQAKKRVRTKTDSGEVATQEQLMELLSDIEGTPSLSLKDRR